MKFSIYRHNISYYITEMGEDSVEFIPVENFTMIKVNDHTYVLPYGLLNYDTLYKFSQREPDTLVSMLESNITGAGVSKYGYDTRNLLDEIPNPSDKTTSDYRILIKVLKSQLESANPLINGTEYRSMIDTTIQTGNLKLANMEDIKDSLLKYGKSISPEIHNLAIPAFIELVKQLKAQGILDDIKDPVLMIKNYQRGL